MNTERIKERNEIAKTIYLKNTIVTESVAYNAVQAANEMMAQMYGRDWESENDVRPPQLAPSGDTTPIVSIAEQDGGKGVRLCVGDVDIFIEAHDLNGGDTFEWDEAMDRLKEVGKQTFSKKQAYLIAAYKDEINKLLEEIGGDPLASNYWSSTEGSTTNAWAVYFSNGYVYLNLKYYSNVVRPCAAFNN